MNSKPEKLFLGIDPGLAKVGYGIIAYDGISYRHITHGVITTTSEQSTGKRLIAIYRGIKKIIAQYLPDSAAIETLFYTKNSKTAMPVAEARGVILFTLSESEIPFEEYSPLNIKLAVTGNGRADKIQIQEAVKLLCKMKEIPKPDHAADALALAICHANYVGFNNLT